MNVLSLFDGISCGQIALERAGISVDNYYASEIDKYAIKVTQDNYPDTIQLGDIRDVHAKDLPEIDLILGGSPCQGFSFAGKQLNFQDPRSKLFFEYHRLLKECNPKYFLMENVRMKKESQDIISEHLGVDPININSNLVSAQNRNRWYWTNILNATVPIIDRNLSLGDISGAKEIPYNIEELLKDRKIKTRQGWNEGSQTLRRMIKNLKSPNEKANCLTATMLKGMASNGVTNIYDGDMVRELSPNECEKAQTVPNGYTKSVSNTQRYKMLGNGWTVDVIAHILSNIQ